MGPAVSLDRFDLKILAHLEREGRCSNVELADAVGLSQSPCLVRTKRLQEIGVIRGYGADIALEKLGSCVIVFSEVTISSHRPHRLPQVRRGRRPAPRNRRVVQRQWRLRLSVEDRGAECRPFSGADGAPAARRYRDREVHEPDRLAPVIRQAHLSAQSHCRAARRHRVAPAGPSARDFEQPTLIPAPSAAAPGDARSPPCRPARFLNGHCASS